MSKETDLQRIVDCGIVSIIRLRSSGEAIKIAQALNEGGIDIVEVSVVTPGALNAIEAISETFGDGTLVGVGTILDAETARAAILSGAKFVIGPVMNRGVIEMCNRYGKISIPGALTPTEVLNAWESGADLVKVFPAGTVGPGYIKDVLAPLPQVRLLPTGGVNLNNAAEFIEAGATAIAVGGALVDRQAVAEGKFEIITEKALRLKEIVDAARECR